MTLNIMICQQKKWRIFQALWIPICVWCQLKKKYNITLYYFIFHVNLPRRCKLHLLSLSYARLNILGRYWCRHLSIIWQNFPYKNMREHNQIMFFAVMWVLHYLMKDNDFKSTQAMAWVLLKSSRQWKEPDWRTGVNEDINILQSWCQFEVAIN